MEQGEIPYGYCQCGCGNETNVVVATNNKLGRTKGERSRYIRGHAGRQTGRYYKTEDCGYETPCWVWQLSVVHGYGRIKRGGRMQQAHRYYYEQRHGALPKGHVIELHHCCENKLCVNPDHIEPVEAITHRRIHRSSATAEIVAEIRRRYVPYEVTRKMLATEYGLSVRQVTKIVQGASWK